MVVATTGFFDGVHNGHRRVIERMVSVARTTGRRSLVVTFWPRPAGVLNPGAGEVDIITGLDEKRALLMSLGADDVAVLPFTEEFSRLTAGRFIREYLVERFGVSTLVVGYDHRLGSDRLSGKELLEECRRWGVELQTVGRYDQEGSPVSSTRIRSLIAGGRNEDASQLLGRKI